MEKIKNKIRELRISKNLTQQQLADELHVTKQAISKWEKGKSVPDISSIELLAEFFGVSVDYLVNDHSEAAETKAKDASPERIIKLNAILICFLAFMTAIVIILSSVILGVLLRKNKQDTSVPNVVSVNGLEFTYIPSSTKISDKDTTFVVGFHIYNPTDYEREIDESYFTLDNDVLRVMIFNAHPHALGAHRDILLTISVEIKYKAYYDQVPMYENLGEVPVHSTIVRYGAQPLVTIKW